MYHYFNYIFLIARIHCQNIEKYVKRFFNKPVNNLIHKIKESLVMSKFKHLNKGREKF
jgi:hypothetical protein